MLRKYGVNHERALNSEKRDEDRDSIKDNNIRRNDNATNTSNIDDFLRESSIRNRLRRLPSVQDIVNSNAPRPNRSNTINNLTNSIDDLFLQDLSGHSRLLPSVQEIGSSNSMNRGRAFSSNESRYNNREQSNIDNSCSTNNISVRPYQFETSYNVTTDKINLYNDNVNQISNTGFRQTLKEIIMVPYLENNKTVSKGSQMYVLYL